MLNVYPQFQNDASFVKGHVFMCFDLYFYTSCKKEYMDFFCYTDSIDKLSIRLFSAFMPAFVYIRTLISFLLT